MSERYQVQFELRWNARTSLNNYEYLDILDRAWALSGVRRPVNGILTDIGCASFWYAAALQCFFRPHELIGIEIDGYRLFADARSRVDHAAGYVAQIPGASFRIADYLTCDLAADVVTAWFPFVTPAAILAWRLPLSLLQPERLFRRIFHNLRPDGVLVMINHGAAEAVVADQFCTAVGFQALFRLSAPGVLSKHRPEPAILSCWRRT